MLGKFLNIGGVAVLSKKQQKDISGGSQTCVITVIKSNGHRFTDSAGDFSDGEAGSSEANGVCVSYLATFPNDRCFYDCGFDGEG